MRINRQKKVNRFLNFYQNNFGFRRPFQIIVDGTFCHTALQSKLNVQDQLTAYLGEDIKILTTPCAIIETEKLGPAVYGAMLILKQFAVHRCDHKNPVSGPHCIRSMVKNRNPKRYFVATQDRALQTALRSRPPVPVIFLHHKAPHLDQPSDQCTLLAKKSQDKSIKISEDEEKKIVEIKKAVLGDASAAPVKFRKRKRKGGPNPLSCKKKKAEAKGNKKKKKKKSSASSNLTS